VTMDCVAVESLLSASLDSELEDAGGLERHLSACESCRRKRALLRAVQAAVRRLPPESVSDAFASELRLRLDAEAHPPRRGLRRRWSTHRRLALAGALAAAVVFALWTATYLPAPMAARPVSLPLMTPDAWPGLDCGLEPHLPPFDTPPCAAAEVCGPPRVSAAALSVQARRRPACVKG
jgi:hypothetical protein